ncbi:MAG: hypothetical protein AAFU50_03315 [Pseudomonadota bacterium]
MAGLKSARFVVVAVASGLLGGCSSIDGVELNGGVFDMMGISKTALSAKSRERKMAARPGIVMPPDTKRLPQPGSRIEPQPTAVSWPVGPEDRERQLQAQKLAEHKAFCDAQERKRKTFDRDAQAAQGPLGSCDPGLYERYFGGNKTRAASN